MMNPPSKGGKATLKVNNAGATIERASEEAKKKRGRPSNKESSQGAARVSEGAGKVSDAVAKKKKLAGRRLRDDNSFATYIFRVMKDQKPEMGISKKSIRVLNHMMIRLFEKIMEESRQLLNYNKKATLTAREIEASIKMLYPGELRNLAIQYGRKTLEKLNQQD